MGVVRFTREGANRSVYRRELTRLVLSLSEPSGSPVEVCRLHKGFNPASIKFSEPGGSLVEARFVGQHHDANVYRFDLRYRVTPLSVSLMDPC